MNKYYVR